LGYVSATAVVGRWYECGGIVLPRFSGEKVANVLSVTAKRCIGSRDALYR
jgi:hypothetical protein